MFAGYTPVLGQAPDSSEAHNNSGVALFNKGDKDGAIAEFREALRLNPNDGKAHYYLGFALNSKGDLDGAIAEYREAVRLNPNDGLGHFNLGLALLRNTKAGKAKWREGVGKHEENVIKEFREAVRLMPRNDQAHYLLGTMLESRGDRQGAFDEYRVAHLLKPDDKTYENAYINIQKRRTTLIPIPIPIP